MIGTDCAVVDPLYNYRFDLNPLKRLGDFNVSTDDFMYQLRICDHLMNGVGECTGSKGVGVCQIDTKAQTPTHRNAGQKWINGYGFRFIHQDKHGLTQPFSYLPCWLWALFSQDTHM